MAQSVLHTSPSEQVAILVKFSHGAGPTVLRYARWDSDITVGSDTYSAIGFNDEGGHLLSVDFGTQHGGIEDVPITVTGPQSLAPFTDLSTGFAHAPVSVTVSEVVIGNEAGTYRDLFFGRVSHARRNPSGQSRMVALTVKGIKADLTATLGLAMTTECQSWLGHPTLCKVDLEAIKEQANELNLDADGWGGRVLVSFAGTVDLATSRKWVNGYLEFNGLRLRIKRVFEGEASATEWQSGTAYAADDKVNPASTPAGLRYRVTTAGTSHASTEPTWPTTAGGTVSDNGIVWTAESVGRFSLTRQPPASWEGKAVVAYPGCDGQITTCRDVYNNESEFAGYGHATPTRNPVFELG